MGLGVGVQDTPGNSASSTAHFQRLFSKLYLPVQYQGAIPTAALTFRAPKCQLYKIPLKGAHPVTPCIPPWGIPASLKTLHEGPAGCRDHLHLDLHTQHSFPGNLHAWSRIQPCSCRKSSSVEERIEHGKGFGGVFLKCCLGGNSKALIPSPSSSEGVPWRGRLSREMWKCDPAAVSGIKGKGKNNKERVRRGIPELSGILQ